MTRMLLRALIGGLAALAILVVVGVGGGAAVLATSGLPLGAFAPTLERRLADEIGAVAPGWRIRLGDLTLRLDTEAMRLRLAFRDVRLERPDGGLAAAAPLVALKLDPYAALDGRIALREAEIQGVRALLRRAADGRFRFALLASDADPEATAAEAVAIGDDLAELVARAAEGYAGERPPSDLFARFDGLAIRGIELTYLDEPTGRRLASEDAALVFERADGVARGRLDARLRLAPEAEPATLTVTGVRAAGAGVVDLEARLEGLAPPALARHFEALAGLGALDAPVTAEARARLRLEDGALLDIAGVIEAGAGALDLGAAGAMALERARVALTYDASAETARLERFELSSRRVDLVAQGELALFRDAAGALAAAHGALAIEQARFEDPALFDAALVLERGRADVTLARRPDGGVDLAFDAIELEAPDARVTGSVRIGAPASGGPVALDAALGAEGLAANRLVALWPATAANGAREWVAEHVTDGRLHDLRFTAHTGRPDGAPDAVEMSFGFDGLSATYLGAMPPITAARGTGRVTAERFELALEAGVVDLGPDGALALDGSRFEIADLAADATLGEIRIVADGSVRALLALLDREPLAFVSGFGLRPSAVEGTVSAQTTLRLPLEKDVALEDIAIDGSADAERLALTPPGLERRVAFRTARLAVDARTLRLEGAMTMEGLPRSLAVTVDWRETFAPAKGAVRSRFDLDARPTAAELEALGAPERLGLEGAARVKGVLTLIDGAAPALAAEAELAGLAAAAPALGWSKPKRAAGALSLVARFEAERVRLEDIALEAAGLTLEGSATLAPDATLRRFTARRLRVEDRTDIGFVVEREGAGLTITAQGARLALSTEALGGSAAEEAAADRATPMRAAVAVERLDLGPRLRLEPARAETSLAADGASRTTLDGRLGGAAVTATLEGAAGGGPTRFAIRADDAGAALAAIGVTDDSRGGALRLDGVAQANGRAEADLAIDDMIVDDAPILADLLSAATVIGAFDQLRTGGGVTFSRMRAGLRTDGRSLEVIDGAASGPSIGFTLEGRYAFEADALDLSGTLSPAFAINGLVSRIPLIGDLITGGEGEGVIGIGFRIRGSAARPEVSANPLSVLTPGPLRRIFGGAGGESADAPRRPRVLPDADR